MRAEAELGAATRERDSALQKLSKSGGGKGAGKSASASAGAAAGDGSGSEDEDEVSRAPSDPHRHPL